mmetsp:Transcript_24550/g.76920  ORF Transcript_24550/g.76920 Transcript_24550/m.76920 type:complete len:304 (-) Transcript_24550:298-1209(-)
MIREYTSGTGSHDKSPPFPSSPLRLFMRSSMSRLIWSCASFSHTASLPSSCALFSTSSSCQTDTVPRSHIMSCCCRAVTSSPPAISSATSSASSEIISSRSTKPVSYSSSTLPNRPLISLKACARRRESTSGSPSLSAASRSFRAASSTEVAITSDVRCFGVIFSLSSCKRAGFDSIRSSCRTSAMSGGTFLSSSSITRCLSLLSAATAPFPASPASDARCRFASSSCRSASSSLPCRASPVIRPSITTAEGEVSTDFSASAASPIRRAISDLSATSTSSILPASSDPGAACALASSRRCMKP